MSLTQRINQIVSATDPSEMNQLFQGCQDYLDQAVNNLALATKINSIDEQLIPALLILMQTPRLNLSNPRDLGFEFTHWLVSLDQPETTNSEIDLELQAAWLFSAIENFSREKQDFFNA